MPSLEDIEVSKLEVYRLMVITVINLILIAMSKLTSITLMSCFAKIVINNLFIYLKNAHFCSQNCLFDIFLIS
jgi:hypothetical protein